MINLVKEEKKQLVLEKYQESLVGIVELYSQVRYSIGIVARGVRLIWLLIWKDKQTYSPKN